MTPEYQEYISSSVYPWLKEHVSDSYFRNGTLHFYEAVNPNEKASIVMIHGFCEFFGKYHETAYRFYQAGYSVFFLELTGHGLSARQRIYEDQRVYIESFDDYVSDIHEFMNRIVKKHSLTGKYFLFAHSMGGAAGALYLEKYTDNFKCAVLSSPMLAINYHGIPDIAVEAMSVYSDIRDMSDDYAPGQAPFPKEKDFENSSCMDEDRYEYQFEQRMQEEKYQTWGGTWGWTKAAKKGVEKCARNIDRIKTPVLLCQAGADTMVKDEGQNRLAQKNSNITLISYEGAKHELLNASEKIRNQYYHDVLDYFRAFSK